MPKDILEPALLAANIITDPTDYFTFANTVIKITFNDTLIKAVCLDSFNLSMNVYYIIFIDG